MALSASAKTTLNEAEGFLTSLKVGKLSGDAGCEALRIFKSEMSEPNWYLGFGEDSVYLLNPYTLENTDVSKNTFSFKHISRGGSVFSPYPSTTTVINLVKDSSNQLVSAHYSFIEKSGPFSVTEEIEISCEK